jgi:hypothetical protein
MFVDRTKYVYRRAAGTMESIILFHDLHSAVQTKARLSLELDMKLYIHWYIDTYKGDWPGGGEEMD